MRTPVTTLTASLTIAASAIFSCVSVGAASAERSPDVRADATSPNRIEIDRKLRPDTDHLARCGQVEFNLTPSFGIIEVADLTGDGTADDRLSIRKDGSGSSVEWYLHLETAGGVRSEARIPSFTGHVPAIGDAVQLDEVASLHPTPAADEVMVRYGYDKTAQHWMLFGIDERGCISAYDLEYGTGPGLMLRHDDTMRSGWTCLHSGEIRQITATRSSAGRWSYEERFVRRSAPTSYLTTSAHGQGHVATSQLPWIGDDC